LRIAFETRWMTTSNMEGVGGYTLNLLLNLLEIDRENSYLALFESEDKLRYFKRNYDLDRFPNLEIKLIDLSLGSLLSNVIFLPRFLKSQNIDVYHSPYFVLSPMNQNYRIIATIYDLMPFLYPRESIRDCPLLKFIFKNRWFSRLIMSKASAFVASSDDMINYVSTKFGFSREKFRVIKPGVGSGYMPISDETLLTQVSNVYGIPRGCVLFMGCLGEHVRINDLAEAYLKLDPDLRKKHKLVIVGRGEERYPKSIPPNEDIIFPGYIKMEDKPAVYSLASAFMNPTLYEGFPLQMLEAMACGVPVAASNIPQFREFAAGAFLEFDPNDVNSTAAALNRILTDESLRTQLKERGLAAAGKFKWEGTAKEVLELYKRL
jgi:glycosyltransferase involved in cell wall biosynthesis